MRSSILILIALCSLPLAAQRHKLNMNGDTPEGQLLMMIGQEAEGAPRRTAMMESFVEKYPKNDSAAWVFQQLQTAYLKNNEFDKALGVGEKLLAIDPMDVETAQGNLKASEGKKDANLVLKWAGATSRLARKTASSPQPSNAGEVDEWKRMVDYSKQVDIYTEYSLYAMGLQTTDAPTRLKLFNELEAQNGNSQYMKDVAPMTPA